MIKYDKVADLIRKHEGLKLLPYKCPTGHLTIGYGHNLENGISIEMAETLLFEDIDNAVKDLEKIFPVFDGFPETWQNIFINMMFNMGLNKFTEFKNMIEFAKIERWNLVINEMKDSVWYRQVKNRANELIALAKTIPKDEKKMDRQKT